MKAGERQRDGEREEDERWREKRMKAGKRRG